MLFLWGKRGRRFYYEIKNIRRIIEIAIITPSDCEEPTSFFATKFLI